jgi:DNA repair protein RadD
VNLRPYQQQLINGIRLQYQLGHKSVLAVLPTGGGKTIIFSAIAQSAAAKGNRVLILVHRRELINQASSKLQWIGLQHGIIAAGIPPSDHAVQIASVQTLARRLSRLDWQPTLIIIDEAHHATAGQWARILDHWPDAYRLGVTATPCRLDGCGLRGTFDTMVLGPSVADLIFTGYLSPARIYAPPVVADLKGIRTRAGDYANDQAAAAMNRPTVTGDAIAHYQRLAAGQQAIAFCCNVAHAVSVCDAFKTACIGAELLLGNTPDREQVVADFAAHRIRVLVTVDVVSEGFDVPAASCAILLRPTQSLGLYLQQVGRVLRPAPGKAHAVILDHVGNVNRHGFPDDHRDWSLDDRLKRSRTAGAAAPTVRTCQVCFAAFEPAPQCPVCGANCAPERRQIKQVDGKLVELNRSGHYVGATVSIKLDHGEWSRASAWYGNWIVTELCGDERFVTVALLDRRGEVAQTKLLPVEDVKITARGANRERRAAQRQARTLPELMAIARQRGYSPAWAWKVHSARSNKAAR